MLLQQLFCSSIVLCSVSISPYFLLCFLFLTISFFLPFSTLKIGGFEAFREHYPDLCDERFRKCPSYTSLSQPCLPLTNQGPTRILPFLYLGTQLDALNQDILKVSKLLSGFIIKGDQASRFSQVSSSFRHNVLPHNTHLICIYYFSIHK